MLNDLPHEAFCHLSEAAACAAAAQAVADLAQGEIRLGPDAERSNRLANLLSAVTICLTAAAAAHERAGI